MHLQRRLFSAQEALSRLLGWLLLSAGLLALLVGDGALGQLLPALFLLFGCFLICIAEGWLTESETTQAIRQAHRSAKAKQATAVHRSALNNGEWLSAIAVAATTLCLTGALMQFGRVYPSVSTLLGLAIPTSCFIYGSLTQKPLFRTTGLFAVWVVLLSVDPVISVLIWSFFALAIAVHAWSRSSLRAVSLVAVLTYILHLRWYLVSESISVVVASLLTSLVLMLAFCLPFAREMRSATTRTPGKVLMISTACFMAVQITLSYHLFGSLVGNAVTALMGGVFLSLAAVAWWSYHRHSFAKYLASTALFTAVLVVIPIPSNPHVLLLLCLLAACTSLVGFQLPSYSARMVSLFLTLAATGYAVTVLIPAGNTTGVGGIAVLVLVAFLVAQAFSYRNVVALGKEEQTRQHVVEILLALSLGVLIFHAHSGVDVLSAHMTSFFYAACYALVALYRKWWLLAALALSAVVATLFSLFQQDPSAFSLPVRLFLLLALALIMAAGGYFIRHPSIRKIWQYA
jgi:hypothetical protein